MLKWHLQENTPSLLEVFSGQMSQPQIAHDDSALGIVLLVLLHGCKRGLGFGDVVEDTGPGLLFHAHFEHIEAQLQKVFGRCTIVARPCEALDGGTAGHGKRNRGDQQKRK